MHHDVRYNINDPADAERAIQDAYDYMGKIKFNILVEMIESGCEDNVVMTGAMFTGVQGFPITAMIKKYKPGEHHDD